MKKYILAVVFVFGLFVLNIESCFAASAVIPGFYGSAGANIADLSSAVFKPTQYDIDRCVAVCVKAVDRYGNETDCGVWYFIHYGMSDKIGVKRNGHSTFSAMNIDGMYDFMMKLIDAAESNSRR